MNHYDQHIVTYLQHRTEANTAGGRYLRKLGMTGESWRQGQRELLADDSPIYWTY